MHEVPVNRLGGLSLPRKCVVRLTDRPDMTLDVYRGRKTTTKIRTFRIFMLRHVFGRIKIECCTLMINILTNLGTEFCTKVCLILGVVG